MLKFGMERLFSGDAEKIKEIMDVASGPEESLSSLDRFHNVTITRMPLIPTSREAFVDQLQQITAGLGELPLTAVFCKAGAHRSRLTALFLSDNNLSLLSKANVNEYTDEIDGSGFNYFLQKYGLAISEDGILVHPKDPRTIDILMLNFAVSEDRQDDRATIARIASILDKGLQKVELKRPLSIIWLEGKEDDFTTWFEQNDQGHMI